MRDPITSRILGACFGVYRELGWGFLENVYHRALEIALLRSGARVEREASIPVRFRGELVGEYKADLLVDNAVIVE
ncbi:MAG TPA: GxxExxY protein, partial [Gemmatimonadaceae bacterium]